LLGLKKQGSQILANSAKTCKDEQKTTDKIEPRFHEGEWVVDNDNNFWKVAGIMNGFYILEYGDEGGIRPSIESADKTFHLWTIQDAKDGDVLATEQFILIFRPNKYKNPIDDPRFYCRYDIESGSFKKVDEFATLAIGTKYVPATNKQRDLLFKAIKEAGYEWNDDKKKLEITDWSKHITSKIDEPSGITVKSADEDEHFLEIHPKFKVGDVMRTLQEADGNVTSGLPVVVYIGDQYYHCTNELIAIKDQEDYEYPPMNRIQKPTDKVELRLKVGDYKQVLQSPEEHSPF
jgi:hypothetical protein